MDIRVVEDKHSYKSVVDLFLCFSNYLFTYISCKKHYALLGNSC